MAKVRPRDEVPPEDCERFAGRSAILGKYDTIRERWVRDLFRLRGDYAHGRVDAQYPAAWTTRDHLLLASFVVPLILKLELAGRGLYTFKDSDSDGIDAFEALCCADHYYRHVRDTWTEMAALLGPDASRELINNEKLVPIPPMTALDSGLAADELRRVARAALRYAELSQGKLYAILSIRPGAVIHAESGRPNYYWFGIEPDPWPNCHVVTFESLHPGLHCSTSAALVRADDATVLFFGSLNDEG
jgi:hypothetical protein